MSRSQKRMSMLDRRRTRGSSRRPVPARELCHVEGCGHVTTERKPYCIDHLDRLPYVRELQAALFSRDQEEQAAFNRKGWRAIDTDGSRAREIIDQLAVKGAQTPKRLAITVEIRPGSLESYLGALEKAGLVKTLTLGSRRGTPRRVVTLTEDGQKKAVTIEAQIDEAEEAKVSASNDAA
jgi:hypothetical protein